MASRREIEKLQDENRTLCQRLLDLEVELARKQDAFKAANTRYCYFELPENHEHNSRTVYKQDQSHGMPNIDYGYYTVVQILLNYALLMTNLGHSLILYLLHTNYRKAELLSDIREYQCKVRDLKTLLEKAETAELVARGTAHEAQQVRRVFPLFWHPNPL